MRILPSLIACAALASVACAAQPSSTTDDGAEQDLTAASLTAAHFTCTGDQLIALDVLTTAKGRVKVTAEPSTDLVSSGKLRKNGSANLGEFLSEDHGSFAIKLDADMLGGRAGHAVLTDDEPGDPASSDTYSCALAK